MDGWMDGNDGVDGVHVLFPPRALALHDPNNVESLSPQRALTLRGRNNNVFKQDRQSCLAMPKASLETFGVPAAPRVAPHGQLDQCDQGQRRALPRQFMQDAGCGVHEEE
eukprot:2595614-Lingulodinium_polyedra.AAC.1